MTRNRRITPLGRVTTGLLIATLCAANWIVPPAAAGAPASEDPKAAARAEVQQAQLHYKLGRFDQALAAYSRAYEMFNAPALLFNIGQCHKNLKNYERAIFFFEGYLREETKRDAQKRTLAEELITESRAELERQRATAAAQEAAAKAAAAQSPPPSSSSVAAIFGAPPPIPSTGTPLIETARQGDAAANAKPLTRKWWFWTAVGVGALAIIGGTIAYYASAPTTTVLPSGSLGTLDRR